MDAKKKIEATTYKLTNFKAKIESIAKYSRDLKDDSSKILMFRGMMTEIKDHYYSFNSFLNELIDSHAEAGTISEYPSESEKQLQQNCDRYYYEAWAALKGLDSPPPVRDVPAADPNSSRSFSSSRILRVGLATESLPKFNGSLEKWPFYRDTFTSMVHNETEFPVMEKYRALIGSLEGPALTLIKGLPVLEQNYEQAWKLLTDNYNNKRILGASYLSKVIDFKPLSSQPTLAQLQAFISNICENVQAFNLLEIPNAADFILLTLAMRGLDPGTRHSFERRNLGTEFPSFKSLHEFLRGECTALTLSGGLPTVSHSKTIPQPSHGRKTNSKGDSKSVLFVSDKNEYSGKFQKPSKLQNQKKKVSSNQSPCPVCSIKHSLFQCELFRSSPPKERFNFLRKWSGCRVCLSCDHSSKECVSEKFCATCSGRHHSWLHLPCDGKRGETNINPSPVKLTGDSEKPTMGSAMLGGSSETDSVILGTVVGQMRDISGKFHDVRMVLDCGSQYSFVTKHCVERLGLTPSGCSVAISGIGHVSVADTKGMLDCCLRSTGDNSTLLSTKAIVLEKITGNHPQMHLPANLRQKYLNFPLADNQFWKPGPIEFLLGSDLFYDVISGKPIQVAPNIPKLTPTIFGYVVGGRFQKPDRQRSGTVLFAQSNDLASIMEKFWLAEEVTPRQLRSADDVYCEQHFARTHTRTPTGRYVVSLPFKEPPPDLTHSRHTAKVRFLNLEQKLIKNPPLKESYCQFMQEYFDLKHMSIANKPAAYMIPHHGVYKVNDPNPKLRVVFDASCRTRNGSLNDFLHAGPTLQNDIGIILLRFRRHQFVFTTDIVKNFRQVLLDPKDRKYQHILWRSDPDKELVEYELDTVTYGTKPAPYLCIRTLHQLVCDEGQTFPAASETLMLDTYVDDIASGADTLGEALELKTQLINLLKKGQFELSKWTSNVPELLEESSALQSPLNLSLDDKLIKILGLQWDPVRDGFTYSIDAPALNVTKRSILSAIARIYDPLGYVSPVVCYAKIILQRCWVAAVDWDSDVPTDVAADWEKFVSELHVMSTVVISRYIPTMRTERMDVVGFCDASELAFGANIYLRVQQSSGVGIYLLKSKTKLSPLKRLTIPRLELSAALLLSKVYLSLHSYLMTLPISTCFWFSDSTVTLGWLRAEPANLKTWVAHRVVEVNETMNSSDWHHVRTHENPADCASRGCLPSEFVTHPIWMNGPDWLCQPFESWPIVRISEVTHIEPLPELKGNMCLLAEAPSSEFLSWIEKFSSYGKVLRIMSYVVRFLKVMVGWPATGSTSRKDLREKFKNSTLEETIEKVPVITAIEYEVSERILIKLLQQRHFPELIEGSAPKYRHTARLNPFVDLRGVVRVGGRLTKAPIPFHSRFPILLPKTGHFVRLFVDHHHRVHLHVGSSSLHAILRNRYWILSGRSVIKQQVHRCAVCVKATKQPKVPFMGNLPSSRFAGGRAFIQVGVDFAGPYSIRDSLRRKAPVSKAWMCLFVCMASKALHLELVSSLSTPAFLSTLDRFIARRGLPSRMHSDCGTNFQGASRELKELHQWYAEESTIHAIANHLAQKGIEWSFNPPASPNFGGLWEAGVKSTKSILHRISSNTAFTFEELSTMFCRIEAVLNSRPLCPISDDPESLEALTPGHFLIGAPLLARPEPMLVDLPENRLSRWQLVQQRVQHFWVRWRNEYLSTLQERGKWTKKSPNMEIGELVILRDRKDPPTRWTLARIVGASPGEDGILRVVEVRTASGVFSRPVSKLVSLKQVTQPESESPTNLLTSS